MPATLGKYEIRRLLARGAIGTVYEAFDPVYQRTVAIRTVHLTEAGNDETTQAVTRFRREAQAAGRLTHPNIVGLFDYGEVGGIAYIVMEYVDGRSVKSLVDKQERFAIPDTMRIMTDLLNALQFSHTRGVVHRDIKPANVMLTSDGQSKIADFGIARIESSSMTQAGTVLGTPAYMSPEQFMGQVVDARTDIYSSGVLLYQLLTGEQPFEGGMSAIMHKALNTDPPLPSQITVTCPQAFDGVVRKAMAKRPEDRFQSAMEFLEALQEAAAGRPLASAERAEAADAEATMVAAGPRRPAAPAARPAAGVLAVGAPIREPSGQPPGIILWSLPTRMKVWRPERVEVRVGDTGVALELLYAGLRGRGTPQVEHLEVAPLTDDQGGMDRRRHGRGQGRCARADQMAALARQCPRRDRRHRMFGRRHRRRSGAEPNFGVASKACHHAR